MSDAVPLTVPRGRNVSAFHNGDVIFATVDEDGAALIDWEAVTDAANTPSNSASASVAKLLLVARGRGEPAQHDAPE